MCRVSIISDEPSGLFKLNLILVLLSKYGLYQKTNFIFFKEKIFVKIVFDPGINLAYKKHVFSHLKPIKNQKKSPKTKKSENPEKPETI